MRAPGATMVLALVVTSCASRRPAPVASPTCTPPRWERTVVVAPDARRMEVTTCFHGATPERFEARAEGAALPVVSTPGCVVERVSLSGEGVRRIGETVVIENSVWLSRPAPLLRGTSVRTRFELPDGYAVSVPWPRRDGVFVMNATALTWEGYTAIGPFRRDEIVVGDTVLDVARFGGMREVAWPIASWLSRALTGIRTIAPGLRLPRVQVLLVPTRLGGDAVGFGLTSRGGGASVMFLVDPSADGGALMQDWQSTHEFVHLVHPVFVDDDAWLREGLATWYQEVLRVRVGALSREQAWRRLRDGFIAGRARPSGRTLAEESASMNRTGAYTRVYWWGAAVVFLADVALRRETAGRASMDTVLAALHGASVDDPERAWSAREAAAFFDGSAGVGAWGALEREAEGAREFPDVDGAFQELGVRFASDGAVSFDETAPLARVREAIMREGR